MSGIERLRSKMAWGRPIQEYNWNANAGIIEEITKQIELCRVALSGANAYESLETLRTFYDLSTTKTDKETDKDFDVLVTECTNLLLNVEKATNNVDKTSRSIKLSAKLHEMNRWIIRLMVQNKLIKLDADVLDPVKEVENDY